jgi:hypothetical protein
LTTRAALRFRNQQKGLITEKKQQKWGSTTSRVATETCGARQPPLMSRSPISSEFIMNEFMETNKIPFP